MKNECDLSKGERGKFYRENARLVIPIYLNEELQSRLELIAVRKGVEIDEVVTELLERDVKLLHDFGA
ncbi:MAG: hypothetical protein SGI88_21005 [Candidatus Hydrogenedentes bacterium]|nr:hypothetical protein [Candidatus Hydrogenedentota bacterium]